MNTNQLQLNIKDYPSPVPKTQFTKNPVIELYSREDNIQHDFNFIKPYNHFKSIQKAEVSRGLINFSLINRHHQSINSFINEWKIVKDLPQEAMEYFQSVDRAFIGLYFTTRSSLELQNLIIHENLLHKCNWENFQYVETSFRDGLVELISREHSQELNKTITDTVMYCLIENVLDYCVALPNQLLMCRNVLKEAKMNFHLKSFEESKVILLEVVEIVRTLEDFSLKEFSETSLTQRFMGRPKLNGSNQTSSDVFWEQIVDDYQKRQDSTPLYPKDMSEEKPQYQVYLKGAENQQKRATFRKMKRHEQSNFQIIYKQL